MLEAEFNFENLTLKSVKNLTFITDDILIRGDIILDNSGIINQIKVHEFKRQLDDFSANITLQEDDYFTLDVSGKSININNFYNESSDNELSGKVNILVKNLFFNNLNFGNTKISSEIYKNKMVRLNGKIYDNKKEHSYFDYIYNKNKNSELKLTFLDFGLFLKKLKFQISLFLAMVI